MSIAVAYPVANPIPAGASCLTCSSGRNLVRDHCHEHGLVRGVLCVRCNNLMGYIDRLTLPSTVSAQTNPNVADLVEHASRCSECPPVAEANIRSGADRPRQRRTPRATRTPFRAVARIEPALLSPSRASEFLGDASERELEEMRVKGIGPRWKKMGRSVKYPLDGLREYVASLPDGRCGDAA